MQQARTIHVVSAHAEGEVGDVIVGGVLPPPGDTLWEQRGFLEKDGWLRNFVLNEPRGGVFRHVNLLVPPKHPEAQMGFIIMEPEFNPPMSGSNSFCVATVLLQQGIIPMVEPFTELVLEAPGGLVRVRAECEQGKVKRIYTQNLPSFVDRLNATIDVEGFGTIRVDTAYGGDSFVIVDAKDFGFELVQDEARDLAKVGMKIAKAANEQLGFSHVDLLDWNHISFCAFCGPDEQTETGLRSRSAVAIQPGKIDRSPTGTAVSARMALYRARGQLGLGQSFEAISILGSSFKGKILEEKTINGKTCILPEISGRAWVTGVHQHMLDPTDPWPEGYRLSDSWGCV